MSTQHVMFRGAIALAALVISHAAGATASSAEADQLKSSLTPLGAERGANKDGSIPAWTGGYTTTIPGAKNGLSRTDPFAADKPLYSITAQNMAQYADKLTDGTKAMFQKYPQTYRIDVYPTRRTGAAPQWVYDNTFKNATHAKISDSANGLAPEGAFGGTPFPVPKSGIEVLWNHMLRWRGEAWHAEHHGVLRTAEGKKVLIVDAIDDEQFPFYFKGTDPAKMEPDYWLVRIINAGPPVRAGEGIVGRVSLRNEDQAWVYLTGQRRVRKLPNACCDTPSPQAAGIAGFDDIQIFSGRPNRFEWKLVGKKEMIIPYNNNKMLAATKDTDVVAEHHLNPDLIRWELHRVWVVEADLKSGQRHQTPKSLYYFDEDTWGGVLADRWDAKGQLWKTLWSTTIVVPELPANLGSTFGFYDLISGAWFAGDVAAEKNPFFKIVPRFNDSVFTPDGLVSEGVR